MIVHLLWGYLYVTSCASILILMVCISAARADQIRERTTIEAFTGTTKSRRYTEGQKRSNSPQVQQAWVSK